MNDQYAQDARHRQQDEDYVQLLNRYKKPLFRLILCMVRSPSDAEDLFQQTAITMWDKFREFEPDSDFFAWASSIARFKVRDFVKSKARQKVYFSEELVEKLVREETAPAVEELRLQALADCRKKLSTPDQELLAACYSDSNSMVDIAGREGRSAGSVYSSLWRIRRALYACIQRTMSREGMA